MFCSFSHLLPTSLLPALCIWGSAILPASTAEMGGSRPLAKVAGDSSWQSRENNPSEASPGDCWALQRQHKPQERMERGKLQEEASGGRREQREGGSICCSRQPCKLGGVCQLGYTGRSQGLSPALHTLPRAQPLALEEENGLHP